MTYLITVALVSLSGLFSGLTLGLLSLNKNELERKIALGNKQAKKVYSVRKRGNLLLCTLLLGNVGVNSALAIFLGNIASGVVAGLVATGLIVVFGEIIPQATFARYALQIGAKTAWLVKIFMFVLLPICWPIAWILDKTLGDEIPTIYSKKELMKIVEEHKGSQQSSLDSDEERIIKGALSFSEKTAKEIMTPRSVVFSLDVEDMVDKKLLKKIKNKTFTRIPIFKKEKDNIVGILYIWDLINIVPGKKVSAFYKKQKVLQFDRKTKLDEMLNLFITEKQHMAFIKNEYHELEGVVTLEDVLEEILKQEIVDENDKFTDMQKKAKNKK